MRYNNPEIYIIKESSSLLSTVTVGVSIFLIGQILVEFIIKPLREYKNTKNEVSNKLKLYLNIILHPISEDDLIIDDDIMSNYSVYSLNSKNKKEFKKNNNNIVFNRYLNVSQEIRKLSCDLEIKYLDNFKFIRYLFIKEKQVDINDAVSSLMAISNSLFDKTSSEENEGYIKNIKKHLNLV